MTSEDITPLQAARVYENLGPPQRYLNRLVERLTRLGFVPDDPWFDAALKARDAVQSMRVTAFYSSQTSGVGTPER